MDDLCVARSSVGDYSCDLPAGHEDVLPQWVGERPFRYRNLIEMWHHDPGGVRWIGNDNDVVYVTEGEFIQSEFGQLDLGIIR
jgi:hypothetical protein